MQVIDTRSQRSIFSLLKIQADRLGASTAIRSACGQAMSYAMLFQHIEDTRRTLRARGVASDTRVAIVLPNGLNMALALLGVSCTAIAVPLNPAYQEHEYEAYFRETRVTHLLLQQDTPSPALTIAQKIGVKVLELTSDGYLMNAEQTETNLPGISSEILEPDNVAMILLTSGSTGRPKKVPLTHRNLCASAIHVGQSLELTANDVCLSMWEQYHIGGLTDLLLAPLFNGSEVICAGSFNTRLFYELFEEYGPTWFQGVPATLRELIVYGKSRSNFPVKSSLRFVRSVAAALPPALMGEIEHYFGVPVIQTFGMTEASPLITTNRLPPGLRKPASSGTPCGPEVSIMDENGRQLGQGILGQIAIRGENVFSGYEDSPEANESSFRSGWFYTGDTGFFDTDGYLFLRGRNKEMINRGGEKVSPYEIEDILSQHPAVSEAAAFPVPHPTLGEDVGVAAVIRAGCELTEPALQEFVAKWLSAFKVPRTIMFLDVLPRCPVGKILRTELADRALQARTASSYIAPRGELEVFLAKLWAAELGIPLVGIDDDFAALGGDSLSSVRLLTAIEALLDLHFSDDITPSLTSVRQMAQHIETIGYSYSPEANKRLQLPGASLLDLDVKSALSFAATHEVPPQNAPEMRVQLDGIRSNQFFKSHWEAYLNILTPAELIALLDSDNGFELDNSHESLSWKNLTGQEVKYINSWVAQIRQEIVGFHDAKRWCRQTIDENVQFYSARSLKDSPSNKMLVVGFCGVAMRLLMPTYRLLMHLDANRHDLVLLRDPSRNHYETGIHNLCMDINSLGEWTRKFAEIKGYESVSTFGTSAGGLAALCVGVSNGWDNAISIGADLLRNHPDLRTYLAQASQATNPAKQTKVVAVYGELNQKDSLAAMEIAAVLPYAKRLGVASFDGHNALHHVFNQGHLKSFLNELLGCPIMQDT